MTEDRRLNNQNCHLSSVVCFLFSGKFLSRNLKMGAYLRHRSIIRKWPPKKNTREQDTGSGCGSGFFNPGWKGFTIMKSSSCC
jgi:hypothetical protein